MSTPTKQDGYPAEELGRRVARAKTVLDLANERFEQEVVAASACGLSLRVLAEHAGITHEAVRQIVKRHPRPA